MSKKDEALKLALDALEATLGTLTAANEQGVIADTIWFSEHETLFDYIASEIDALRRALEQPSNVKQVIELYDSPEQPAQEPVGEVLNERGEVDWISFVPTAGTPLYTSPQAREWVGLTDEQATKAALWDLAIAKGLITVHSEQLAPGTWSAHLSVASWMEGHDKACDISNEAAHGIGEKK